ncbi:50S ribosomal protein L21 [Sulfurospirillum sp. 1307]|jgi:large subunit ribosomal protein L21
MYAIIKNGGKQYKVQEGDYINLDHLDAQPKDKIVVSEVLAVKSDDELKVGTPFVDGAKVELEVITDGKDKKVVIYKKRRRKDSKLKRGFRRQYTKVKVLSIQA